MKKAHSVTGLWVEQRKCSRGEVFLVISGLAAAAEGS